MSSAEFVALQSRLRAFWPQITLRSIGDIERVVVVAHSVPAGLPDHLVPVFPAYEERFLCLVLSLLRAPRSRVVYVTSQPIHPRVLDYYFGLVPELDTPEARGRFVSVSLVDGRNEPLAEKLLRRPGAIERIRALIGAPELAFVVPFAMSEAEVELAVRLGIPAYGCDPWLAPLGTKTGSRRVFADEGVPHPAGLEIDGEADIGAALAELRRRRPEARGAVLKLDRGVSGLGNALIDLDAADGDVRAAVELEDTEIGVDEYFGALDAEGGIIEERIEGPGLRSPSVQLRVSPSGQVDILSTHDQVLGGPHGQTYFGCHFPASMRVCLDLASAGRPEVDRRGPTHLGTRRQV